MGPPVLSCERKELSKCTANVSLSDGSFEISEGEFIRDMGGFPEQKNRTIDLRPALNHNRKKNTNGKAIQADGCFNANQKKTYRLEDGIFIYR